MRVIITDRASTVEGQIADENHSPAVGATAILFQSIRNKWYDGSRLIRNARTDQKGSLQAQRSASGASILGQPWIKVEQGAWDDP